MVVDKGAKNILKSKGYKIKSSSSSDYDNRIGFSLEKGKLRYGAYIEEGTLNIFGRNGVFDKICLKTLDSLGSKRSKCR